MPCPPPPPPPPPALPLHSTLLLAPVCPHTAEHIRGTLLKRLGLVLTGAGAVVRVWCGMWGCGVVAAVPLLPADISESLTDTCCFTFSLPPPKQMDELQLAGRRRRPPTTSCSRRPSESKGARGQGTPPDVGGGVRQLLPYYDLVHISDMIRPVFLQSDQPGPSGKPFWFYNHFVF